MTHTDHGFTLIEVLIAITLMAIAFAGIATMGISSIQADTQSRGINAATALVREKLDQLRILPHSDTAWGNGTHTEWGLAEDGSSGSGPYERTWVVQEDYNLYTHLHQVTVTVSWYDGQVSLSSVYR